jgi:ubiquinol-cytochrome c reductase cytochrome b subunit
LPFLILGFTIIHLLFLHQTGSNNPLGLNRNRDKISFYPYYLYKDIKGFLIVFFILLLLITQFPFLLSDPDNFTPANPLRTPAHIQPE